MIKTEGMTCDRNCKFHNWHFETITAEIKGTLSKQMCFS